MPRSFFDGDVPFDSLEHQASSNRTDRGRYWRQVADSYVGACIDGESAPRAKELAAYLHLSPDRLSRAFLESTGMALSSHFALAQLEHCKKLLIESSLSVTAIPYRSGFGNRRTFHRFFKRVTSETPAEFRERARKVPRSAQE